jgi:hypothetical protein
LPAPMPKNGGIPCAWKDVSLNAARKKLLSVAHRVADESDPSVYPRVRLDNVNDPLLDLDAVKGLLRDEQHGYATAA